MKRCPHCNSPITQPDRKTCPVCGNPLSGPTGAARRRLPPWVPVVLLCAVAVVVVYFALHKPVTLPADIQVPAETTPESAGLVLDEADRFYLDNLPTNITFTLTVDGAEQRACRVLAAIGKQSALRGNRVKSALFQAGT